MLAFSAPTAFGQAGQMYDIQIATGSVSGSWQGAQINSPRYNDAAGLYVTVEDNSTKKATLSDPNAVTSATWKNVTLPLSGFTGVNMAKVKKLSLSGGDPKNPVAGGSGRILIDDITLTKP